MRGRRLRTAARVISAVVVLVCATLVAVAWQRVEAPVPVHWNGQLTPDRYGSKTEGLLLAPAVLALLIAVCVRASRSDPGGREVGGYALWIAMVLPLGLLTSVTTYNTAFGTTVGQSPVTLPLLLGFGVAVAAAGYVAGRRGPESTPDLDRTPEPEQRYWFRAKRYGWGWGLPATWEGWLVLACFLMVVLGPPLLAGDSAERSGFYLATVLFATALLLAICVRKGEPTRWRWGGRD